MLDTVDGDGVAEAAAQQAAEKTVGDLSPLELREAIARFLGSVSAELRDVIAQLANPESVLKSRSDLADLSYRIRDIQSQVQP